MSKNIRANLIDNEELQKFLDNDGKLVTSKQMALILNLKSDAALRKQRSKGRNLLPYARVGRSIYYPLDLVMKVIHSNVVEANLRGNSNVSDKKDKNMVELEEANQDLKLVIQRYEHGLEIGDLFKKSAIFYL